jgi:diguanylate cyclase (GGDEF)-like protein
MDDTRLPRLGMNTLKILLIDDDKLDRMNTIRLLSKSDWKIEVVEAFQPEHGLELAKQDNFDLILLDYQLPTMTGLEVLSELRSDVEHQAAVVMLSHSDDVELAKKCIKAGAQDFIIKQDVTQSRLSRAIIHSQERFRIEKELRESHESMKKLSELDSLTGLANRYMFEAALEAALIYSARHQNKFAILFLDLDKFKDINDTLGHNVGDSLLKSVATRLSSIMREGDVIARLGGDEFAILVNDLVSPAMARKLAERSLDVITDNFKVDNHTLSISASIGIATYPDCGEEANQLLKCADVALYRAKDEGRNKLHFYSKVMHEKVQRRIFLERELQSAIHRNELSMYFQPQVDAQSKQLIGAEALVRWQHPTLGFVPPDEFIPIAEDTGQISNLAMWVYRTIFYHFSTWLKKYDLINKYFTVSINMSAVELKEVNLAEKFMALLSDFDIPVNAIRLELTESALTRGDEDEDALKKFASNGINLSLDDFGTGYSSLSRLQQFPFTEIKIDKSFIDVIEDESSSTRFIKALSDFAKAMEYEVVAEGIETELQYELCAKLNIDIVQGYYFSKPLPADEFEALWLEQHYTGTIN